MGSGEPPVPRGDAEVGCRPSEDAVQGAGLRVGSWWDQALPSGPEILGF